MFVGVSDHDLLAGGVADQVRENYYAFQRMARLDEFRCRMERDYKARRAEEPHFTLTPLQETVVEAGELWGMSESQIRSDLRTVATLKAHFPEVLEMCLAGALHSYLAELLAHTAKLGLDSPEQYATFADTMTTWLRKRLRSHLCGLGDGADDGEVQLVNVTVKQLRNKLNYELKKLKPRDADERFKAAFKHRRVRANYDEDGMGSLWLSNSLPDVQLAHYRLNLIAQALRNAGDKRTMEQLRSDVAVDLLIGRIAANPSTGDLEDAAAGDIDTPAGRDPGSVLTTLPSSKFARPVVIVTVPYQTLMGISDHPATMSGGSSIPPTLARIIANDPDSTWYRMLTDPAGEMVELSTEAYRPTPPIWRDVAVRFGSCFRRNCGVPAAEAECDHRVPYPHGKTSNKNLNPGCKRDHKAKHAPGYRLSENADGKLQFRTRAGFTHDVELAELPVVVDWPEDELFKHAYTATEILDAVRMLKTERRAVDIAQATDLDEDERWLLNSRAS